jgi:hypothetical protein
MLFVRVFQALNFKKKEYVLETQLYLRFKMFKHSIKMILKKLTLMTLSYVVLSSTITSVGFRVTTVACLGAFCIKANSPKESPGPNSAIGTYNSFILMIILPYELSQKPHPF